MSWKTTVLGVCSILSAVISAVTGIVGGTPVDWNMLVTAILAGIGLIAAKDSAVK